MDDDKFVDRKWIAREMRVSVGQVRKNEGTWGLFECRAPKLNRCVRYWRRHVERVLRERGWVDSPEKPGRNSSK